MKTVWILNHYAVLPSEAGSTRHFEILSRLVDKDWTAVVLAASFSHWQKKQRVAVYRFFTDHLEKQVRFRFIWTPRYTNNGVLRMINMFFYFILILTPGVTRGLSKPSVIVGSSVHPLAAWAAQILARRHNVPFIYEVRDLWPETLIAMNRIKQNSISARFMRWLEKRLFQRAQKIIVLLPHAELYISRYGIDENKIEWIPNGVALNRGISSEKNNEAFTIMYAGAHGEANGLDVILDAIKILKERRVSKPLCFRFIGEGESKQKLINKMLEYGLDNVKFEKGVSKNKIPELLSEADAFIISVNDLPRLYQYGISMNKIFDYMAAGKPVIAALSAANNPIIEANAGITVEPGRADELADAIEKVTKMSEDERNTLGRHGQEYIKKYHDYDVLAKKFNALLDNVV
jgi:glycosyltransferase involved in cell wall biosynthesis